MELFDDSTDDIFTPASNPASGNRLDKLFQGRSDPSKSLHYKGQTKEKVSKNDITEKKEEDPFTAMVLASAWDGKSYKNIGKLGLALIKKDSEEANMVLYKSKQQVVSMTTISSDAIKVEQHSPTLMGSLDNQGRAWTLQFSDVQVVDEFVHNLLKLRLKSDKKWVYFLQSKGRSERKIKNGDNVVWESSQEPGTEKQMVIGDCYCWQECLINQREDCVVQLLGTDESFSNHFGQQGEIWKMICKKVLPKVEENPKEVEKYLKKIGKPIIPQEKEKGMEEKVEKIERNQEEAKAREVNEIHSSSKNDDIMNLIITENRLQNTELRLSIMKMNEKLDKILLHETAIKKGSSNEQVAKKAMNKMFKQLKSKIDADKSYSGEEVIDMVADCIRSTFQ